MSSGNDANPSNGSNQTLRNTLGLILGKLVAGARTSDSYQTTDTLEHILALIESQVTAARREEAQSALDLVESGAEYQDIRADLIDRLAELQEKL